MSTEAVIPAGLTYCYYGNVNSSGYMVGTSDPTAGSQTGSGMGRIQYAKTVPIGVNEPDFVQATGDDTVAAQWPFDSNELPNGILESAVTDLAQEAVMQNTNTFAVGDGLMGVRQPKDVNRADTCLILQSRAKSADSGTAGTSRWHGVIVPVATLTPLGGDPSERTPLTNRIAIAAQNATQLPWGATLQTAIQGTESAPIIPFNFDNPVTCHVFKGDDAETAFTVGLTPVSDAKCAIYLDGLVQSSAVWSRSRSTFTMTAAPGDGSYLHIWYEFDTSA